MFLLVKPSFLVAPLVRACGCGLDVGLLLDCLIVCQILFLFDFFESVSFRLFMKFFVESLILAQDERWRRA